MSHTSKRPPEKSYGEIQQHSATTEIEEVGEQVHRLGYAILDSGLDMGEIERISKAFDQTHAAYVEKWGEQRLRDLDELHTIRALLVTGDPVFRRLAMNRQLLDALEQLIVGKYVLNQQNGIVNPPGEAYNQAAWHRDLPYQHFVSSSPLAINALYCVDDLTLRNGATFVLPASHKAPSYPSKEYIERNALQVEAKAGQYILLDCMFFQAGGRHESPRSRSAINHAYNIPYFKQQINLPGNLGDTDLTEEERSVFGYHCEESASVDAYLKSRERKQQI